MGRLFFIPPRTAIYLIMHYNYNIDNLFFTSLLKVKEVGVMKKVEELEGFRERNKKSLWIFSLDKQYCRLEPALRNYPFNSEWLKITPKGQIIIEKGYSWNGCSPKKSIFDIFIVGTFDGYLEKETGKPKLYEATLVHDALYQYYGYHGIPRKVIDILFLDMMREKYFRHSYLYYLTVRIIGRTFFKDIIKVEGKTREFYKEFWSLNRRKLRPLYILLNSESLKKKSEELYLNQQWVS